MNGNGNGNGTNNIPMKRPAPITHRRLLGEARRETVEAAHLAASRSKRRRLASTLSKDDDDNDNGDDDNEDDQFQQPISSGALGDDDAAVFADAVYEDDDVEADLIYEQVEKRMLSRRQKQRDEKLKQQLQQYRKENPTIKQQFADLKSGLNNISENEWDAIPDIGDYKNSIKNNNSKFQKFTPIPDSMFQKSNNNTNINLNNEIETDLAAIGKGRTSVLEYKLDNTNNMNNILNKNNLNTVDHDGYLAEITGKQSNQNNSNINEEIIDIGEIKRMRHLLQSVVTSNPKHAPGWIASARLEEKVGKLSQARRLILQGCKNCVKNDEVWVEAARLHPRQEAKRLLAKAVRYVPKSQPIWIYAIEMEPDENIEAKKRIIRKALEIMPRSELLWMMAVQLENRDADGENIQNPNNNNEKRIRIKEMLKKASKCVSKSVKVWLALARVEDGVDNIKAVLHNARQHVNNDDVIQVWVAEAQMEEERGGKNSVEITNVLRQAIRWKPEISNEKEEKDQIESLNRRRQEWLQQAEVMERAGYIGTVRAIVCESARLITLSEEIDRNEAVPIWKKDAKRFEVKGCIEIARSFWYHLTRTFSSDVSLWTQYADFERRQRKTSRPVKTEENEESSISASKNVQQVLEEGVSSCSSSEKEILWLMLAKEVWKQEGEDRARQVLKQALQSLPGRQSIWVAAAKVETESGHYEQARSLLKQAREMKQVVSGYVYVKSALLERLVSCGRGYKERELLIEGLEQFTKHEKLWLMLAQWHERAEERNRRTGNDANGKLESMLSTEEKRGNTTANGTSNMILETAANGNGELKPPDGHEEKQTWRESEIGKLATAKSVYVKGVENCPKSVALWLGYSRLEERYGSVSKARAILERGRSSVNKQVDVLWSENVCLEMRQKNISTAEDSNGDYEDFEERKRKAAMNVLARGLKECKKSGRLWALSIALEEGKAQKSKSVQAVKACPTDVIVIVEVGRYLWRSGKIGKAREWFERGVEMDNGEYGDSWATYIAMENELNNTEKVKELIERCCGSSEHGATEVRYGDAWVSVRKAVGYESLPNRQVLIKVSNLVGKQPVIQYLNLV